MRRSLPFQWVQVVVVLVCPFVVQIFRTSTKLQLPNAVIEQAPYLTTLGTSTIHLPTEESKNSIHIDLASMQHGGEDQEPIPHNFIFHSWGPEGIELQPILRFMHYVLHVERSSEKTEVRQYNPVIGFVAMHNGSRPMMWFPLRVLRQRNVPIIVGQRLSRMLVHFQHALGTLLFDYPDRFQAIIQVLEKVGSFPFVMDLSDYSGCCKDNYKLPLQKEVVTKSLPLMTLSRMSANCSYFLPLPTYTAYDYSAIPQNGTWDATFKDWSLSYPRMEDKIRKAFWRGSCGYKSHRAHFVAKAQNSSALNDYLDVFPTNGDCGRNAKMTPIQRSMRYRAVLDIDGNSWSERFTRLLCYNSVVIKVHVDPDFEEYFMPTLTPGVHYLPASLENFTEVAKWAVQNSNLDEIKRIVKNANNWCKRRIQSRVLNYDFLTVLNGFVQGLSANDPKWIDRWATVQDSYFGRKIRGGFVYYLRDEEPSQTALTGLPTVQRLVVTKLAEMTESKELGFL
jgi:hypothetical protein